MIEKDYAFLILNYNSSKLSLRLVDQILHISFCNYVVLVDNNSSETEVSLLKNQPPNENLHIIYNPTNNGYAAGNNVGIRYLRSVGCEFVVICNPDINFEGSTLNAMLAVLRKDQRVGLVGAMMRDLDGNELRSAWRIPVLYQDLIDFSFVLRRLLSIHINKQNTRLSPDCVEVVQGAFFAARIGALDCVGDFDEGTFLYCEEEILGMKLKEQNFKVKFIEKFDFQHAVSGSIDTDYSTFLKKFVLLYRSKLYYYKHIRSSYMAYVILQSLRPIYLIEKGMIQLLRKWF